MKKFYLYSNLCLLVWFFFDMFGLSLGSFNLVESAWKEIDGIWYLIYIILFSIFYFKNKYGKYPLTIFLILWAIIQFSSHWYYTIFGASQEKIYSYNNFYKNTYHIIPPSNTTIIPDLYHIILHLIIISTLISMVIFCINKVRGDVYEV